MLDPLTTSFGVPLVRSAADHVSFLEDVSRFPALQDRNVLQRALYRYEHMWLPLAARFPHDVLAAPLDVEWVWHCHLLAPVAYQRDCKNVVGTVVDHRLNSPKVRAEQLSKSRLLWETSYPRQPFEVTLDVRAVGPHSVQKRGTSKFAYDVIAAAGRQSKFYYQVCLPHYKDDRFLKTAETRYRKFLLLKQRNPALFIVPCYDVDLIWHTHQLHPLAYKQDTEAVLGSTLNHDDTDTDRRQGSKLHTSDQETRELWQSTFGENFSLYGAMYRGEPPEGKLFSMSKKDTLVLMSRLCTVKLETIELRNLPRLNGQLKLEVFKSAGKVVKTRTAKLHGGPVWQKGTVREFLFNTRETNCLKFRVSEKRGFACQAVATLLGECEVDLLPVLCTAMHATVLERSLPLSEENRIELSFKAQIGQPKVGPIELFLQPAAFSQAVMPENVVSMWGPVPLRPLPAGTQNLCDVANHRLLNLSREMVFTCRMIHSIPAMQSVVHVFYHDKMAAVAHLVGSDVLPLPTQVVNPKNAVYLNPVAGERGVLIKNHAGDWGFVVGRWSGMKRGVPGTRGNRYQKGKRGVPGSPGTLLVRIWLCGENVWHTVELPYKRNRYTFSFGGISVNFATGAIEVDASIYDVAEKLALTFSVSLLHVLCQPRPPSWRPGQSLKPPTWGRMHR